MNRNLFRYISLALCLALLLSGCSAAKAEDSEEYKKERQMKAMEAFLADHRAEMEEIVDTMMRECEGETSFTYLVDQRTLKMYGAGGYMRDADDPAIPKADTLDKDLFTMVYTDTSRRIVGNDICCFSYFLDDNEGRPYCEIVLFYCEEEPFEHPFFDLSPVIPHWYFYIEYRE